MKAWVIRDAQLRAFEEPLREEFRRRAMAHLRAHFESVRQTTDEALRALVENGVARAAAHGIIAERDVSKFLSLTVALGPEFDEKLEWARRILGSDAGPTLKVNRLVARAVNEAGEGG